MAGVLGLNPTLRRRLNATGTVDPEPKKGESIVKTEQKILENRDEHNVLVGRQASPDRAIERSGLSFAKVGDDSWAAQKNKATSSTTGAGRFDPSKLTLGNAGDNVGFFKDGKMLENSDAASQLGAKGGGSFIGKINTDKMTGTIDYTDMFNQDANVFAARLNNAKNDYRIGEGNPAFFTGPGEPGPGNYGQNSAMSQFKSRRDLLQSRVDEYNKKNPITAGMSVGDIVSNTMATSQLRNEIKQIDEQILGRTQLYNKIMEALIGARSALDVQGAKNQGDFATQALKDSGVYKTYEMRENAETGRTKMQIDAGRFAGNGNSEKTKNRYALINSALTAGYKSLVDAGNLDGAQEYLTNGLSTHYGDDDEIDALVGGM